VTAPPSEKLTKAAGLTVASTVTGGIRDLAVVLALGVSRRSDGFLGLFLVTQFLYMVSVGGHLLSLGRIGALGADARDGFYHRQFFPRLRRMAAISLVVTLVLMRFVYHESFTGTALIAAATAAVLLCRGEGEYRSYVAISGGALNTAMLAAIWQNVLIIVACLVCWVLHVRMLAPIVLGVALGFAAQAWHLRRWKPGARRAGLPSLDEYRVPWELSTRELLLYGGPAIEQVLLGLLPGGSGTGTIVVFARRIAGTVPAAFAVPFGMKLISGAGGKDEARANKTVILQSLSVLVVLSLAVAQLAVVGLRILRWMESSGVSLGPISKFRIGTLLGFTVLTALGSIANALHTALSRQQQVLGQQRRVLMTTGFSTGLQLAGIGLGLALRSPNVVVAAYTVAWIVGVVRDFAFFLRWRDMRRDQVTTLLVLPALFLLTAAMSARTGGGNRGSELVVLVVGCVPLAAYALALRHARRHQSPSWI
jgi:hypothetical protein